MWMASIEQEISKHNFHDMLSKKKATVNERAVSEVRREKPIYEGWMYKKVSLTK